jgi:hypothetical protein
MNSLMKSLLEPKCFEAYIDNNMKTSTYKALWKNEISDVEYCASKVYQARVASYAAAMVGSVISKNGEKPLHQMPDVGELVGSIGHIGDEWELDNDYLEQIQYLEGRMRDKFGSDYMNAQKNEKYDELIKYSFKPFERAVIAPHKRIDMLYFEGLYKGTQTVSRTNNTKANVSYTFDLGIKKIKATTSWGTANATPFADIKALKDEARKKGRKILKLRMSETTFYNMCQADEIKNTFKLNLGTLQVNPSVPIISQEQMNVYLRSIMLPTIQIDEDQYVSLADGTTVNLIPDNYVVAQCDERVAVMKVSDALELGDPIPNVAYSSHDDNLVGYWRDKTGYHITADMWAQPVFNGINNLYILETTV